MDPSFENKVYWVNKYQPGAGGYYKNSSLVSEKTNIMGQKVQVAIGPVVQDPNATSLGEEIHVFRFFHEPQRLVRELWLLWVRGQEFSLPGEFGMGLVRFAKDNPIKAVPVVGEDFWHHEWVPASSNVDKYNGEIRVMGARAVNT